LQSTAGRREGRKARGWTALAHAGQCKGPATGRGCPDHATAVEARGAWAAPGNGRSPLPYQGVDPDGNGGPEDWRPGGGRWGLRGEGRGAGAREEGSWVGLGGRDTQDGTGGVGRRSEGQHAPGGRGSGASQGGGVARHHPGPCSWGAACDAGVRPWLGTLEPPWVSHDGEALPRLIDAARRDHHHHHHRHP